MRETYNRNIIIVDDIFASTTALTISNDHLDPKPKTIAEWKRSNWVRLKQAIKAKLDMLNKRKVFGSVIRTPQNVILVKYK